MIVRHLSINGLPKCTVNGSMVFFSNNEVKKVLRLDIGRQTLLKAEKEGRIPRAERIQKGRLFVRGWKISDLPNIGEKYGKFKKPVSQKVISFFTGKGGVLKSTLAFNFGRVLALHGIKTLLIGLDMQESITTLSLGQEEYNDIEELKSPLGLYSFFSENISLKEIIRSTSLPTLDVVPENFELNLLEKELRNRTKRESIFKRKLIPHLKKYDIIIFDNSPNWNLLIENSLVASKIVFAPISCEIGTYQALNKNLKALLEFKKEMEINWDDYTAPTLNFQ